ncbi:MAG: hypothetical protein KGJ62_15195 [Armatimonadetes bacterium]|nr:hypothetical protein [Armatimonadota bacterium]MDE2206292.1 hypothetical protein [Armatimonadota bacterium]
MIETITTHLFDLLEADAQLIAGGSAWPAGFAGVRRIANGDAATAGCVNLFDHVEDADSNTARPAIYCGAKALELEDRLESWSQSSPVGRTEYRLLTIPLMLVCAASGYLDAKRQRNQLLANVRSIMMAHMVEPGYWFEQTAPGAAAGGDSREVLTSSAAGGGAAESGAAYPLVIRYSIRADSPA